MFFVERLLFYDSWKLLSSYFDIDSGADFRASRRDIRHAHAPVQARRKGAACYFADALVVLEDGVMRSRRRSFFFHSKWHELFARSFFFCFEQNVASDEVGFWQIDKEPQPCLARTSFWGRVGAVPRVAPSDAPRAARTRT